MYGGGQVKYILYPPLDSVCFMQCMIIISLKGDPGQSVEGGWKFTNGDGTFELTYKADEEGFQPTADHLPVSPDDTNEVSEAKTAFYSLYEEAKARVAEAVAAAETAETAETAEKVVEVSKREAHSPSWRRFWRR